uniref:Uncharacterized protein n=1 Tax=Rhizophora mucronata TaxID=61149 RepID=A0A2P2P6R4_RHIMU
MQINSYSYIYVCMHCCRSSKPGSSNESNRHPFTRLKAKEMIFLCKIASFHNYCTKNMI